MDWTWQTSKGLAPLQFGGRFSGNKIADSLQWFKRALFLGEQGFWPDSIGEALLRLPSPPLSLLRPARPMQRRAEVTTLLGTVPCGDLLAAVAKPGSGAATREVPRAREAENGPAAGRAGCWGRAKPLIMGKVLPVGGTGSSPTGRMSGDFVVRD